MFKYRNTRTGAVVSVPCHVGGDWELVEEPEEKPEEKPTPKKTATKKKTTKK